MIFWQDLKRSQHELPAMRKDELNRKGQANGENGQRPLWSKYGRYLAFTKQTAFEAEKSQENSGTSLYSRLYAINYLK